MAAENTFFKTRYTDEEINACYDWFERNMDHLPMVVALTHGIKTRNAAATARRMMAHLRRQMHNSGIFCGEFANLLLLRDRILATEGFQEQT